jgi:hypothetical protein
MKIKQNQMIILMRLKIFAATYIMPYTVILELITKLMWPNNRIDLLEMSLK